MSRLTHRQYQVCELLALGRTNKEIARELGIGRRTVEEHRAEIYKRMAVRNIAELVRKVLGAPP